MSILRTLFGPGTWGAGGNLVAWVICGALGTLLTFLLRKRIGPKLAAWWHGHAGEHMRAQLDEQLAAHRDDLRQAIDAVHRRLDDHADLVRAQHQALKDHVASVVAGSQDGPPAAAQQEPASRKLQDPAARRKPATPKGM